MKNIIPRKLKVGKTDAYLVNVTKWLSTETITGLTVNSIDGLVTVGSTSIDGGRLKVLLTGVTKGLAELHFEFSTIARNDCAVVYVQVVDDC